ncbi:MAG TPA: hypothetical protein VJA25_14515 [Dehalococcoidia bacterium]|nr:hypothetical protein [Dehalococcoidia bacterium]
MMEIDKVEEAIATLKKAGIEIKVKTIRLKRREIARINELLTLGETVIVTHSGRRATVFTKHGYRARLKAGEMGNANKKKGEQPKPA